MRTRKLNPGHLFVLLGLLALPTLAAARLAETIQWLTIAGFALAISVLAYWLVAGDKVKAQNDEWRTKESTLHLFEVLGGWPGSYVAQRRFRHKIRKSSYQATYWTVVGLYQLLAFDYLRDWQITNTLIESLQRSL